MGFIITLIGWAILAVIGMFALLILLIALGRQSHDGFTFWERLQADPEEIQRRKDSYRLNAVVFWLFGFPAIMAAGVAMVYGMLWLLSGGGL